MTIAFSELLNFAVVIFILGIFPGLGVTTIISITLNETESSKKRWKIGIISSLGILSADLVYVLLVTSAAAFFAMFFHNFGFYIKITGILILLWFAIENLFFSSSSTKKIKRRSPLKTYFFCFSVSVSNPKVFIFYLGFLPGFFNLGEHNYLDVVAILGTVFVSIGSAFLMVVAFTGILTNYFSQGRKLVFFNKIVGIILFVLVIQMILEVFPQFFS